MRWRVSEELTVVTHQSTPGRMRNLGFHTRLVAQVGRLGDSMAERTMRRRGTQMHMSTSVRPREALNWAWGGGGGGGVSMSKQAVSLLLECLVGSLTPHEPIYPVVKVREHVYKRKHTPKPQENESFNAGYGRSESFSQIVGVEVAGWEDGGHSLFKLVFIHGNFLLVITVGSILFL